MSKTVVTFDNGNSHPHLALFLEGKRVALMDPMTFLARYPYHEWKEWSFIVSHVGIESDLTQKIFALPQTKKVKDFRLKNKLGEMNIHYQESLGDDRLVQAYALHRQNKNVETILIDAGTFITVDLINGEGLQGGYIFPGVQTFLNSFKQGAHLPSLDAKNIPWEDKNIPHATDEAILKACAFYIDSILNRMLSGHPEAHFVLTGGSCTLIKERLTSLNAKNMSINPYLIHDALFDLNQSLGEKNENSNCCNWLHRLL